jgi:hypothetical protein
MRPRARFQDGGPMQTVRVATFAGPGEPPVIREVPKPEVPPKAALIRVAACGVCGTDLHILKGHWPRPLPWPFTLGHELVGVVEEIGGGADRGLHGPAPGGRLEGHAAAAHALRELLLLRPFTERGIGEAIESAIEMRSVNSTIVPAPELVRD